MFGKKPKKKPASDEELMLDLVARVAGDQARKARRRKWRNWRQFVWPAWLDRRLVVGVLIILIVVIADAVRREDREFAAVVTEVRGVASWQAGPTAAYQALVVNAQLEDDAVVTTGAGAGCTLRFPDQSVVVVSQNSQFVIRLLEYHRGGKWRSRAFYLKAGEVFARVSPNFGKQSELRIYTPSAVAAVRGTKFYVSHDPASWTTNCLCGDGAVRLDGFTGYPAQVAAGATSGVLVGLSPARAGAASFAQMRAFWFPALNEEVTPDPWYKTTELAVTQTLCGPLTILGIGKASWSLGSTDFARRTAAQEALRLIHVQIEGWPRFPPFVDPATLSGLGINELEAARLLKSFDGRAIERYDVGVYGANFRIAARARDTARTRFVLDQNGVRLSEDQS